jgi:hypothetical protein
VILLVLVEWQVSFDFGEYAPTNAAQTFAFWAVSTLIFLLTVTLGFMLFSRRGQALPERQRESRGIPHQNQAGSGCSGVKFRAGDLSGPVELRRLESESG